MKKMISNQVLQNTLEGLKEISRTDLCIMDAEGKVVASTFSENVSVFVEVKAFAESQAESQLIKGYQYFKVFESGSTEYVVLTKGEDEETYRIGKITAFQIQNLN